MDEVRVARWRKHGLDRLYVTVAGRKAGWIDNRTGEVHVDDPTLSAEMERVAADRPTEAHPASPPARTVPSHATTDVAAARDADLAFNVPGQAVQAVVQRLEQERPPATGWRRLLRLQPPPTRDERAWARGAAGEATVGDRLNRLRGQGWFVLHAVPVGRRGTDIDHVLIGPGGVYTINTKNHPGKSVWVSPTQVRVNGHVVPYLRNSRFEAARASRALAAALGWEVPVRAALVLLTGTLIPNVTVKSGGPDDVLILDRSSVPGVFTRAPTRLTQEQVEDVFAVARRSTTWTIDRD